MRILVRNGLKNILRRVEVDISRFESCNTWWDIWLGTTFLNSYIYVGAFASFILTIFFDNTFALKLKQLLS